MKIFVVSGYEYWGRFYPDDLGSDDIQIAGGETAMISIAKELARFGHDVTVFYDVERPGQYSNVNYLPMNLYVPLVCQMEFDVLVAWDSMQALRFADRAKARIVAFQLNDPIIGSLDWLVDAYMHPSIWHRDRVRKMCPEISPGKQFPNATNGIDFSRYLGAPDRIPGRVIYSSSPDRGLHHLLRIWPRVVEKVPHATLQIFYDMDRWLTADAEMCKQGVSNVTSERAAALREYRRSCPPSVFFNGGVGQGRLAREQLKSHVLAYPCDPVRPTEGFSMTILEGITAGCRVITTNADALEELWSNSPNTTMLPLPIDDDQWVDALVTELRAEPCAPQFCGEHSWSALAKLWEGIMLECLRK